MKVLISRPDKIGDVVLSLHGIKQLKLLRPDWQIYIHVSPTTRPLVEAISFLDGIIETKEELSAHNFDAVVDLMARRKFAQKFSRAGIPVRIGNGARWFRFYYSKTLWLRRSQCHINEAEYNWKLMSLLDESLRHVPLTCRVDRDDFFPLPESPLGKDSTVLMPGVSVSAKPWPIEKWERLAQLLAEQGRQVLFLLGPDEPESLLNALPQTGPISSYRSTDLKATLSILRNANGYIGPSTGVTHIASLFQLPGVALYPEELGRKPRRWIPFQSSLRYLAPVEDISAEQAYSAFIDPDFIEHPQRDSVSAFVICKNEEKNIRRCLESLKWCDEILVVDSHSTDKTLEICREYTDNIIVRDWPGHREQKQFALEQCTKKWVINLDSDEQLSPELREEVINTLEKSFRGQVKAKGFYLCRVVYFLDRWWDKGGWFPEYRMRFFLRDAARWGGVNPHEKALVDEPCEKLSGFLFHYTYTSLTHFIQTLNYFSENSARALYLDGRRSSFFRILLHPPCRFLKFYFLKRGFREGTLGFIVACTEGFYTFLKYSKLWELERVTRKQLSVPEQKRPDSEQTSNNNNLRLIPEDMRKTA